MREASVSCSAGFFSFTVAQEVGQSLKGELKCFSKGFASECSTGIWKLTNEVLSPLVGPLVLFTCECKGSDEAEAV